MLHLKHYKIKTDISDTEQIKTFAEKTNELNKQKTKLLDYSNKQKTKINQILSKMNGEYAKCFADYFSVSEVKTCTRLLHVQTAQTLVLLHSETIQGLTQFP
jgi:hypothetical protein